MKINDEKLNLIQKNKDDNINENNIANNQNENEDIKITINKPILDNNFDNDDFDIYTYKQKERKCCPDCTIF